MVLTGSDRLVGLLGILQLGRQVGARKGLLRGGLFLSGLRSCTNGLLRLGEILGLCLILRKRPLILASFAAANCWIWVDFAESGIFDSQFYELASRDTIFYHIIKERRSRRNHIIQ